MEKAKQAVDAVADGVKKMTTNEKKPKVKKEKGGDGGADNTVSYYSKA
jgi:threonyl-tRNA synthetase